jgi:poly-gamma-glutamate synthesis protein (capsule biosynthesis protein)
MKELITLALVGDVMLGRGVNQEMAKRPPESFFGSILPILKSADTAIANLECAITNHRQPYQRTPKVFHFRADPAAVEGLRAGNIGCVSLANNHILDFEVEGLLDTLHYLDRAGIHHAGAGRNLHEASLPVVLDIAGLKVGVFALTDNEIGFAATQDTPGTNFSEISDDREVIALIEAAVAQAHQAGAEFLILSAHWGPNMRIAPPLRFRDFAHAAIDCGVDLFHGHSAHLFQGVEVYNNRLILYDTGDFLDDYSVDPQLRNDWSFVFLVDVNQKCIQRLRLIPARLDYTLVDRAIGDEFTTICQRMKSLCVPFKTPIKDTTEGLEVQVCQDSFEEPSTPQKSIPSSPNSSPREERRGFSPA